MLFFIADLRWKERFSYGSNLILQIDLNLLQSVAFISSRLVLTVVCRLPRSSVLGPLEFISYTEDVVETFTGNLVLHHQYVDDKQPFRCGKIP